MDWRDRQDLAQAARDAQREAAYERDRYEDLREKVERDREQDYERQRRERHERIQASRASNRLFNSEIDDFGEAMRAVMSEVCDEIAAFPDLAGDDDGDTALRASLEAYATTARDAECIWREEYHSFVNALKVAVIHQLRKRMEETGIESYGEFADALDAEDYTGLAI